MKKLLLFYLLCQSCYYVQAQQTQKYPKKSNVDHFFTCSLDLMLDTLATNYHLKIVYERDSLIKFDVAEHLFNESLKFVLEKVCTVNNLHYWVESDGTIYILQNTDDLARLKNLNKLSQIKLGVVNQVVELPKSPPKHFLFTISGKVVDQSSGDSTAFSNFAYQEYRFEYNNKHRRGFYNF